MDRKEAAEAWAEAGNILAIAEKEAKTAQEQLAKATAKEREAWDALRQARGDEQPVVEDAEVLEEERELVPGTLYHTLPAPKARLG